MRRTLLLALTITALVPPLAEAQSSPRSERKKPFAAFSESAHRIRDSLAARVENMARAPIIAPSIDRETALRDSIVSVARAQIGTPYRLGAESPGKAFDCSGLVRYVLAALHLDLPRTAREQARVGQVVERDTSALKPGDIVAFGKGRRVTHIGIYVGEGRVVHASTSRRRVVESSMESEGSWFQRRWLAARRLLAVASTTSDTTLVQ